MDTAPDEMAGEAAAGRQAAPGDLPRRPDAGADPRRTGLHLSRPARRNRLHPDPALRIGRQALRGAIPAPGLSMAPRRVRFARWRRAPGGRRRDFSDPSLSLWRPG